MTNFLYTKTIICLCFCTLAVGIAAQPTVLSTSVVNGTVTDNDLSNLGSFKQIRLHATSTGSTRSWQFSLGTSATPDLSTNWRPGSASLTISGFDAVIRTSASASAIQQSGAGSGFPGLLPGVTINDYYTFNVSNADDPGSPAGKVMAVLQTAYQPKAINSVTDASGSGGTRTVTVILSQAPSTSEFALVRYSTDNFATSSVVQASFAGSVGTATIPAICGNSVQYYVFTSNRNSAQIAASVTANGSVAYDMLTLNLKLNNGAYYTYTNANALPTVVLDNPTPTPPVCVGAVLTHHATVTPATPASGNYTYTWCAYTNPTGTGLCGGGFSSAGNPTTRTWSTAAMSSVKVTVSTPGCPDVTSSLVVFDVVADPAISGQPADINECVGGTQTLTVTATGGTPSLNYQWQSHPGLSGVFSNVPGAPNSPTYTPPSSTPGTTQYQVVVSATGSGCGIATSLPATVVVGNGLTVSVTASATSSCTGGTAPILTAVVTGNSGMPSYQWEESTDNVSFTPISGETNPTLTVSTITASDKYYHVVVSQMGSGCAVTSASIHVTISATPSVVIGISETSGLANNDGTICPGAGVILDATTMTATGYLWTPGGATTPSITVNPLSNTTYTVSVSFAGCSSTATQVITVTPVAPATIAETDNSCTANDGKIQNGNSATLTASAGASYSWSTGATSGAITVSPSVTSPYTVTITDVNACTSVASSTVTVAPVLSASVSGVANVSCFGGTNGAATVSGSGGTPAYGYNWGSGVGATPASGSNTGLSAGTYTVTITDANNCSTTQLVTIMQPTQLTAAVSGLTNVSCFGGTNGAATVSGSGGTPAYGYNWGAGVGTTPASGSNTGLSAGTYTVTVTDANNCVTTQLVTISQPTQLMTSVSGITNETCYGGTSGAATVSGSGGSPAYSYNWGSGVGATPTSGANTGLSAGTYTVTVTDTHNCSTTQIVTITEPAQLATSVSGITNVSCFGGANGAATVSGSGGTPAYGYNWGTGVGVTPTSGSNTGISAGTYTVTVTDANNCSTTQLVTITQPMQLTVSISSATNVSCFGASNGTVTAAVTGGTPPLMYDWTGTPMGDGSTMISNLGPGTYTITVTDGNGCMATASATITQPSAPLSVTIQAGMLSCNTGTTTATATPAGGTPGFMYNWNSSPAQTTAIANLPAGTFTVTVTDAHNCTVTSSVTINNPVHTGNDWYVNDNSLGGDVYTTAIGNDGNIGTSGCPFATIGYAISQAVPGDVIYVDAGTYQENPTVDKTLTLKGANFGINPNTGSRSAESVVEPGSSAGDPNTGSTILYLNGNAGNSTVDGFTFDGDNPSLSGYSFNGFDIDAIECIGAYDGIAGTTIQNNIFQKTSYAGVEYYNYSNGAAATTGNTITNNKFDHIRSDSWGMGVLLYNNCYADVTNNIMTDVRTGIQTGNFYQADPGGSHSLSGNTIEAFRIGIFHNLHYAAASDFAISSNNFTPVAGAVNFNGMLVSSIQGGVGASISNNNVTGGQVGINLWNCPTSNTITISGGTLSGNGIGVFANNYDGYTSDAESSKYHVSGVTVLNPGTVGIYIKDNPLNSNGATVLATIDNNTTVSAASSAATGILVEGPDATGKIQNNLASIHGFAIGIDVNAGSATINNNHIYNNGIGVRFTNAGHGTANTNNFHDAALNGVDIQGTLTAGAVTATPNNWLSGITYGVENQGITNIDATLNYWNASDGPGAVGPGSGALVTANVTYCPWLNDIPGAFGGMGVPSSPAVNIIVTETSGISNDNILCPGGSVALDATTPTATGYLWSTGAVTASITDMPAGTTTYTVTVTFPGCSVDSSKTITVNPLPDCTISGPSAVCASTSGVSYSVPVGAASYTWSVSGNGTIAGSSTGSTVSVNAGVTGSFVLSVTVTDAEGCSSSCSYTVTVNDTPQGSLSGNSICTGGIGQLTFTATAGTGPFTVVYFDGTINQTAAGVVSGMPFNVTPNPTLTTTYTLVSITDANSCSRNTGFTTTTATITVNPLPQGSISGNSFCTGNGAGQLTFTATSGTGPYTVVYNDGASDNTATMVVSGTPFDVTPNPTMTTTYTLVSVTDANGCTQTSSFTGGTATITVSTTPVVTFTLFDNYCYIGSTLLLSGGLPLGGTYSGTGVIFDPNTGLYTFDPVAAGGPGTYTITYSYGSMGCTGTATADIIAYSNGVDLAVTGAASAECQTNSTFTVVSSTGLTDIASLEFAVSWDTTKWTYVSSSAPSIPGADISENACGNAGILTYSLFASSFPAGITISGSVPLVSITLKALTCGATTSIKIVENDTTYSAPACIPDVAPVSIDAFNGNFQPIPVSTTDLAVAEIDVTPPVIVCPSPITVTSPAAQCSATASYTATATDNCNLASITYSQPSGSSFPVGTTTVVATATDACSNTAACNISITVLDTTHPVITCPLAVIQSNDSGLCSAVISYATPVGMDNCMNSPTIQTSGLASGEAFPVGQTINTFKATDASGNTATCSFTVTINDTESPAITCPGPIIVANDPGVCGAAITYTAPIGTDNCPGAITTQIGGLASGVTFPIGSTTNTFQVSDVHGHNTSCFFVVTVSDSEFPKINCPADIVVSNNTGACSATVMYNTPVGTDNCSGAVTIQDAGLASGATFPVGTTANTFRVTDASGNSTLCTFNVTVNDTEKPLITCPANISLVNDPGVCGALATWTIPTPTDNCNIGSLTANHNPGDLFPIGSTTVTYTVFDIHMNSATCSFSVMVSDTEKPTVICPFSITTHNDPGVCGANVTWSTPVGHDNCQVLSVTSSIQSGTVFDIGSTTVMYTVTDNHSNSKTCAFTVTVNDTEKPKITCASGGDRPTDLGFCSYEVILGEFDPTVSDNCPGFSVTNDVNMTSSLANAVLHIGENIITWTITDASNNQSSCSLTINVVDNESPTIICPNPVAINADQDACGAVVSWTEPTGMDNCTMALTVTSDYTSGSEFPVGQTIVTYTVTDNNLNQGTCSFTIDVTDTQNPTITCAASATRNADLGQCSYQVQGTEFDPTAFGDNCSVQMVTNDSTGTNTLANATLSGGVQVITWTITDASSLTATCSTTITVLDNQPPTINCAASATKLTDAGQCSYKVQGTEFDPTASDNCTGYTVINSVTNTSTLAGTVFPTGINPVTWTVTDGAGQSATCLVVITVNDGTPPAITCPTDLTISNDASLCSAVVTYVAPVGTDNCPNQVTTQTAGLASNSAFPVGLTSNVFTVTDAAGNKATCTFTVTVNDTELPKITCPQDITQSNDATKCSAVVTWTAPAFSDNCPGVTAVADHPSGSTFPVGPTVVTYTVTDAHSNATSCAFTVTVNDTEHPTVTCPNSITQSNDAGLCNAMVTWMAPTGQDNCLVASVVADIASGTIFSIGTAVVTYTVTDNHSNTATCTFSVTVNDTEQPTVTCPAPIVLANAAGQCTAVASWTDPVGHDNCGVATVTADQTSGISFSVGITTVTYTVTDVHSNTGTCTFTITVNDTEVPTITCPGDVTQPNDLGQCGAVVSWMPPVTGDNCGISTVVADNPSGSTFPVGTTTVTYTVTDVHMNSAICSFMVTVNDTEQPTVVCPPNITKPNVPGLCSAPATWIPPTGNDNCLVTSISSSVPNGTVFNVGTTTVIYTVTDNHMNTGTCAFTVTVNDTEAPTITCASDGSRPTDINSCNYTVIGTEFDPTAASDNCNTITITNSWNSASSLAMASIPQGSQTITWTISDGHGQSATCSVVITIEDGEVPTITCPVDATRNADPDACGYTVVGTEFAPTTVGDNCVIVSVTNDVNGLDTLSGATLNVGPNIITWTVSDGALNETTCSFTVLVNDTQSPTIACPASTIRNTDAGICTYLVNGPEFDPSATDNCVISLVKNNFNNGPTLAGANLLKGNITITWTATDAAGLTTACTVTVTVIDNQPPTITCVDPVTLQTDPMTCAYTVSGTAFDPTVADNCSGFTVTNSFNGNASLAGAILPQGSTTVVWSVTDGTNPAVSCSVIMTVHDGISPVISCPSNIVVNNDAGQCSAIVVYSTPMGTDNCPGAMTTQTGGLASGATFPLGVTTNSFSVTDASGNSSNCVFTVTVIDNTPPTALCQDVTVNLDAMGQGSVTAAQVNNGSSDNCTTSGSLVFSPATTAYGCTNLGPNTFTLTVTDASGNSATCTATVTVNDLIAPTAICKNLTVNLDAMGQVTVTAAQVNNGSSDNCTVSGSLILSPATMVYTCSNAGSNTFTLTVTDASNNSSSCTATITVKDLVPPVANCQDVTVNLDAMGQGSVTAAQVNNGSSDNCTQSASLVLSPASANYTCDSLGAKSFTLTVTDGSGNSASCTATVTVKDLIAPTAICQDVTVNLDAMGNGSVTASQVNNNSSDNCTSGNALVLSPLTADYTCTNLGPNSFTLTVTDASNNSSSCTANVLVKDLIAPTALCQNVTVNLDAMGQGSVTAALVNNGSADNCTAPGLLVLSPATQSYTCANLGSNSFTLTVTDGSGNSASCTASVTVKDLIAPTAICQDVTVNLDTLGQGTVTAAQVNNGSSDNCTASGSLVFSPLSVPYACANLGANTFTLTVTDGSNNSSTCTATVTVKDLIAPKAKCQNVTVNLDGMGLGSVTAAQVNNGSSDNCTAPASLIFSPATTAYSCTNAGPNTFTLTVTDGSGNSSSCTATVTVKDLVPPMAVCQNITVNLDAMGQASVTAAQVNNGSSDNCTIPGSLTLSPATTAYSCSNVGANSFTLTVTDGSNNSSTCTATVTVKDVTAPTAICQNATVKLDAMGQGSITAAQVNNGSSDNCTFTLAVSPSSFTCTNLGSNTVTLTVTDASSNSSTCTATVVVKDTIAPTALCQPVTVYLDAMGQGSVTAAQVNNGSSDNCTVSGSLVLSPATTAYSCANAGAGIFTLTVTDASGNSSSCTASITVADTIRPVITCPTPPSKQTNPGLCTYLALGSEFDPTSKTDNCSVTSVAYGLTGATTASGSGSLGGVVFHKGTTFISWTAFDAAGNSASCSTKVTVIDGEAPVISCPPNQNIALGPTCQLTVPNLILTTIGTDNCGTVIFSQTPLAGSSLTLKHNDTQVVTITASDGINMSSCTVTLTAKDSTVPVVKCPVDITVNPTTNCSAFVNAGINTLIAADNCTEVTLTYTFTGATTGSGSGEAGGHAFNGGTTIVTYLVTDGAGNTASCSFNVIVNPCITISGHIKWENIQTAGVKDATVDILGASNATTLTDSSGFYTFTSLLGGSFAVTPSKKLMLLNGVTTADAARIQQHVTGAAPLPAPYKRIAADVNKSNSITTVDASLISQALLGNPVALAIFNTSWRFVPKSYVFPNPLVPWGFPETLTFTNLTMDAPNSDFIGVKIGDVNGTANPQLAPITPLVFMTDDRVLSEGQTTTVTFTTSHFADITAYQMALRFDPSKLQMIGDVEVVPSVLGLTTDNFGLYNQAEGEIRTVWNTDLGHDLPEGTAVFRLRLKALQNGVKLSEVLELDENLLPALAFNTVLARGPVELVFHENQVLGTSDPAVQEQKALLLQNRPNPFTDRTVIGFVLPEACEAQLRIFDTNGRLIEERSKSYPAGYQEETFLLNAHGGTGVLYYELTTPFGKLARKMVSVSR